ncbi:MAG: chemotaxis protein CheA [Actinomycetota bacterium]
MSDDAQEMRAIFLEEMGELVQDIEKDLLALETAPGDRALVDRLFRNLHTIKGGAGMAGLDALSHYTHAVENMLDEVRKGALAQSSGLVSLLLEALDFLKGFMAEALGEGALDHQAVEGSRTRILVAMGKGGGPAPAPAAAPPPAPAPAEPSPPAPAALGPELNTFIVQIRCQPDFFPLPSELEDTVARLAALGELLVVSHEHSLPPDDKRKSDQHYLWRTFHLVGEGDETAVNAALAGWAGLHKVEVSALTLLPEAPENQARIDAAVDGIDHDVLAAGAAPAAPQPTPAPQPVAPAPTPAPAPLPPLRKPAAEDKTDAQAVQKLSSIRVDTGKLDKLVNLVGELITVEARLESFQSTVESRDAELAEDLLAILDDSSRTLRELQDQAMTIRMVPIGGAFDPMQRLVRDYCRDTGKQVRLTLSGRDTEVDKKVSEQISGPLKHLIRNALDHGVELPADRQARGKAPEGEITLAAYHQYGLIVIEVRDDGRGIDVERVVASARAKGIIDATRELSEREALELIFAPAVSTAKEVTEVSGRGVGMDVVKRDIEALRGTVDIATELGKGTTITVRIPLTLSIVEGLLVTVGDNGYVIPLTMVEECVELADHAKASTASNFLEIRDELIPYLRLRDLFSIREPAPAHEKVVIVTSGDRRVGLVVDALLGDHQTVIKSLSRLHKDVQCFSGATILGDGRVVLILDVLHLIDFGQSREERMRT